MGGEILFSIPPLQKLVDVETESYHNNGHQFPPTQKPHDFIWLQSLKNLASLLAKSGSDSLSLQKKRPPRAAQA